jgi:hypothetical protein
MTPRQRFLAWVKMAPEKSHRELIYTPWGNPRALNYIYFEVKANTPLGKELLKDLGWEEI